MTYLDRSFFQTDPLTAARELLGWTLCFNGCEGIIIETEAYTSLNDEACHTWKRPSARVFVEKNPPGTAYVYLNYGVHWLFNILVRGATPVEDGFVLIRALKPSLGITLMKKRRSGAQDLCGGPGKLTQAFGINAAYHGIDLFTTSDWSFKKDLTNSKPQKIMATPRIGISVAKERLWRFLLKETR